MKTPTPDEIRLNSTDIDISFVAMVQIPIKDIIGYLSDECGGGASFKIIYILLEDGTKIDVEGEHDFPYITGARNNRELNRLVLDQEIMDSLYEQF